MGQRSLREPMMKFLTPEHALIFRITHIENVPWILRHGLHCRNSDHGDPAFRPIGSTNIIEKRHARPVPIEPFGTLSDYVPFYFTPRSPMLLNIKTGRGVPMESMGRIVVIVSSLHKAAEHGVRFLFTDRHAYLDTANFYDGIDHVNRLDWRILRASDFSRSADDPGKFGRYNAEALLHRHVPAAAIRAIGCRGVPEQTHVNNLVNSAGVRIKVTKQPNWFFE